jgi:hypothetical protein
MSDFLHGDLYHEVDVPEVEPSVSAKVEQLTLLVQELWHRNEGHATQLQSNSIF